MIVFDSRLGLLQLEKMKIKRQLLIFHQSLWVSNTTFYFFLIFLYFPSLDPEQKDYLIEVIDKLLKDKTTVRIFIHLYNYLRRVLLIFFV